MKIYVREIDDFSFLIQRAAEITSGKPIRDNRVPGLVSDILEAEHSPARLMMYWVEAIDVPNRAVMHVVRHKIGCEWFISTSRPDRTSRDGKLRDFGLLASHQSLVNLARKRLCSKAWHETIDLVQAIKDAIPERTSKYMVPECHYRGGVCHEPKSCGLCARMQDIGRRK